MLSDVANLTVTSTEDVHHVNLTISLPLCNKDDVKFRELTTY